MTGSIRLCLLIVLAAACSHRAETAAPAATSPSPVVATPDASAARGAVARALPFLARDGDWWLTGGPDVPGGGKCVSCHVVGFTLWSQREAARAGVAVSREASAALETRAFAHFVERPGKAHAVTWSQLLLARAPGEASDARWRDVAGKIIADQGRDGSWNADGQFASQRRPERESDAVATMWAVLALASVPDAPPTTVDSARRAHTWLKALAPGVSTEWTLTRLLVARQLGEPHEPWLAQLLARQRPDGGWTWRADGTEASDALTTGQALYALAPLLGPDHAAVRRATAHLARSQRTDGTWLVPTTPISTRTAGGKIDYIYEYWGTAWATIGLARTLPAELRARAR